MLRKQLAGKLPTASETPEEIAAYIAARKKAYPTAANIRRKACRTPRALAPDLQRLNPHVSLWAFCAQAEELRRQQERGELPGVGTKRGRGGGQVPRPCRHFHSPRGCRHVNCRFLHTESGGPKRTEAPAAAPTVTPADGLAGLSALYASDDEPEKDATPRKDDAGDVKAQPATPRTRDASKSRRVARAKPDRWPATPRRGASLLEKLLAKEIRAEQSLTLQCIRYILRHSAD